MPAIRATVEGSGEDLPLSHLPTACWVTPRRAASSAWLMPCFLRHFLSSSENDIGNAPLQNGILPVVRCAWGTAPGIPCAGGPRRPARSRLLPCPGPRCAPVRAFAVPYHTTGYFLFLLYNQKVSL